ncbi:MAG: hypothetical protein PWQ70_3325, partial [Clostridiales bacterium]|nr:hypothetical protein [Clostridiales bacterium]
SLLRSRAKENKRYSIDVSTLRMMHNAHMNIDAVLDVINKNIKDYYFLDMPEKYIAFKEIINMIKVDLNIADECLKTNRFGTMRKHVNSAEYCMKNISGHPAAVEFNLRLAFYNYILKNMEKAKV